VADLESTVMEWFRGKGIESGSPSAIMETYQEAKLKQIMGQKDVKVGQPSSLLNRRLKVKLTLA
jgi:hypothetical protein